MGMTPVLTKDSLTYYLTTAAPADRPESWELSLHSAAPGPLGEDNEVTDAAYVRQPISFTVDETDPDRPFAYNDSLISYPPADDAYQVTHIVVWDAAGTPLVTQSLRAPRDVPQGGQVEVAPSEILIGVIQ